MCVIKKCLICGQNFKAKAKNQLYCGKVCYNKVHRKPPVLQTLKCTECGTVFKADKRHKYCSIVCKQKSKQRYQKEYNKKEPTLMTCTFCKKRFITRTMTPFCSSNCKSNYFRNKQ